MRLLALFASAVITLGACSDSNEPKSPIAPYTLTTVDQASLPAVMYEEQGYRLEVTSGTVELIAPDTYVMSTTVVETVDGNKSTYVDNETGTWVLTSSGPITMTGAAGDTFTATWKGTQLTVTRDDIVFVYTMSDR